MTQTEKRLYLIHELLAEQPGTAGMEIPENEQEQKRLLQALFNIRMPKPIGEAFLQIQDAYLKKEINAKGITELADLQPVEPGLYLWQGDITTLRCGAIVNAANSQMLGCFCPNHGCIDNAIHTFAGVQLRLECAELMKRQGHEEEVGRAKITPAFNLPSDFVIHTVGPIAAGPLSARDKELLASCYRSCLELAEENGLKSIAFCCISTGEFHFPNDKSAEIAVQTVREYRAQRNGGIEVVFNVFKGIDYEIYRDLLGAN